MPRQLGEAAFNPRGARKEIELNLCVPGAN